MIRIAVLLALSLAACSKAPERKAGTVAAADVAAEAKKLKLAPGEWETTTLITDIAVTGVTPEAMKAATGTRTTTRNCVTPAEAAKPAADFLAGAGGGNCAYQRFSMADAKIDAAMTCAPAASASAAATGKVAMTLRGGYSPTAFDMGMVMKTNLPGDTAMMMRAKVTGKRVGECSS